MNYCKKLWLILGAFSFVLFSSCELINSVLNQGTTTETPEVVTIADVTFSPDGGAVDKDSSVTLNCATEGVKIYAVANPTTPLNKDNYNLIAEECTSIKVTEDCTIYAIATDGNGHFSNVTSKGFSIKGSSTGGNESGNDNPSGEGGNESGNGGNESGNGGESGNEGGEEEPQIITETITHGEEGLKVYGTDGTTELEPSNSTKTTAAIGSIAKGNIVITAGGSGTKAKYWTGEFRLYNGNNLTFTPAEGKTLIKIEFGEVDSSNSGEISVVGNGEYSDSAYTWTGVATSDAPVIFSTTAAFRFKTITLTYGKANSGTGGNDNPSGGESGNTQEEGDDSNLGEESVVVINASNSDKVVTSDYITTSNKTATKLDSATSVDGSTTVLFTCKQGTKPVYLKNSLRAYAGTEIEFLTPADKTLVKVEFNFASSDSSQYSTGDVQYGPINQNRGEYDGDYYVWTGKATPSSHLVFFPEKACWISEIKLTYREGIGVPSELIPPFEPADIKDFLSGKAYALSSGNNGYTVNYTGTKYTTAVNTSALTTERSDNDELLLGNPTGAVNDVTYNTNYLLKEEVCNYTISYNDDTHNPNWVAWHLAKADLGSAKRTNNFKANDKLPDGFYRVTPNDYAGSGFDQGHMLNSLDRTASVTINDDTFFMTNMVPQSGTCNRGTWKGLEDWEQKQAQAGKELYIICGPYGKGGDTQKNGVAKLFEADVFQSKSDSNVNIIVPRYVWKILVVLDEGTDDINRINADTTVVAAIIPNSTCVKGTSWSEYICSVDYIEELTGYDFFANLPDEIEDAIESKKYTSK